MGKRTIWRKRYGSCIAAACVLLSVSGAACGMQGPAPGGVEQTNKSLSVKISESDEELFAPAFRAFREAYPDVDLKVESFPLMGATAAIEQANTQIMAGGGPDLLLFMCYGVSDVYKMMKAGAFAPLDAMIEADDTWQADDYPAAVLEAGQYGGSQYVVPLAYDPMVSVSSQEGLGKIGFPAGGCTDTLSLMENTARLYDEDHSNRILASIGQFIQFPVMLTGQLLDYEGEEMGVDGGMLKRACEAYARMYKEDLLDYGDFGQNGYFEYGGQIAEGGAYFGTGLCMKDILAIAGGVAGNATPVMIPMRTDKGQTLASVSRYVGIRANSENLQNAYRLIRFLMGGESQEAMLEAGHCPLLKELTEEAVSEIYEETQQDGGSYVEMGELDEAFLDEYRSYLLSPGKCFIYNDVSSRFLDDMMPFFEGKTSYEECLAEFQGFIDIYLTE